MSKSRVHRWLSALIVLGLAGCSQAPPVPEDHFFAIRVPAPVTQAAVVLRGGLLVERLRADALRGARAMLYRDAGRPLELRRYHYHYWVEEPTRLIQQQLADYLRAAGVADHVYTGEQALPYRYHLSGRLLAFEREVHGGRAHMHVAVRFTLGRRGASAPLLMRTYESDVAADGNDMHASARAAQQALTTIFHTLQSDLGALELVGTRDGAKL